MSHGGCSGEYQNDSYHPRFNDAPHERPILRYDGTERAVAILLCVLGIIAGLALLLTLVR
jgi:hypothetical protein